MTDPQTIKTNARVTVAGKAGVVWSYHSKAVSKNGAFSHWDRKYWIRFADGSTGEHTEQEISIA